MKNSEKNIELSETGPVVHIRLSLEGAMQMRESLQTLIQFHDWDQWNGEGKVNLWTDAHHLLRQLSPDFEQVNNLLHSDKVTS